MTMEKYYCPKCKIRYDDSHNFCSKCGTKLVLSPEWEKTQKEAKQKETAEERKIRELKALCQELSPIKEALELYIKTYRILSGNKNIKFCIT